MSSFSKMVIMPSDEAERLRDKKILQYNPAVRSLAHLDAEMESILSQQNIDVEEKLLRYQTALMRFGQIAKAQIPISVPRAPAIDEVAPTAPALAPPVAIAAPLADVLSKDEARLAKVFPKKQEHIHEFSKYITNFPDKIAEDERGQLVLKGESIEGSNYFDLLKALFQTRSAPDLNLIGHADFINQLKEVGVAPKLVVNTTTKRALKGTGRIRRGIKRKIKFARVISNNGGIPGIKTKVLRLYQ